MKIAVIATVVVVLVYIVWVVVPNIYFERRFPPPRRNTNQRTLPASQSQYKVPKTGRYRVTLVSAKIFPTNKKDNCWDACMGSSRKLLSSLSKQLQLTNGNGWQVVMGTQAAVLADQSSKQPDVQVEVKFGSQPVFRSPMSKNTLTPQWGTFHDLTLRADDTLRLYVWDKDPIHSDLIGYYATAQIPPVYLAKGGVWKLKFHRVYELQLAFKPLREKPPQTLKPGRYRITIVSAIVKPHRPNGKSWDFFKGHPDPYATVHLGPHQLQTQPKKNTLYPAWNHSRIINLQGDEKLRFSVHDKDFASKDQIIGSCRISPLNQIKLKDGVLYRGSCGQVQEINIKFDRIL